ncbi:unnamed protein product, partial [marine sediment metagenome]
LGKYDNYKSDFKLQGDFKPKYEIYSLKELFDIINEINNKRKVIK